MSDKYLRIGDVIARYGNVDRTTIYRWQQKLGFPREDAVINGVRYWRESTISAWDEARKSDNTRQPGHPAVT